MAMMAAAPVATVASIRTTWQLAMSGGSRRKCSWRGEGERGGGGGRGRGEEKEMMEEEEEEEEENEVEITTCFYSCYFGLASGLIGLDEDLADCWVLAN